MPNLLRLLDVAFVLVALVLGVTAGITTSMKSFGAYPGFRRGAIVGGLFTTLGSMMAGYLVAGRMEDLLGTGAGVPVGLAVGAFAGSFAINTVAGTAGVAGARVFARK